MRLMVVAKKVAAQSPRASWLGTYLPTARRSRDSINDLTFCLIC